MEQSVASLSAKHRLVQYLFPPGILWIINKKEKRVASSPITWTEGRDYVSSKSSFLVDSGSKGWQYIIRQKAAIWKTSSLEFINPEPLEKFHGK